MNIKSIVCCVSLLSCTYLFGGDIYQIMQQEAPQPSAVKKPTQIPMKRRFIKPGAQAPVIEKEQPAMTSSQGMEYLNTALQKEKAQQKVDQTLDSHSSQLSNILSEVRKLQAKSETLATKDDIEELKQKLDTIMEQTSINGYVKGYLAARGSTSAHPSTKR